MNDSTTPKELVFLKILNSRINKINYLVEVCDPLAIDHIDSTIKLMDKWKEQRNIHLNSVEIFAERLTDSLKTYKEECSLDLM